MGAKGPVVFRLWEEFLVRVLVQGLELVLWSFLQEGLVCFLLLEYMDCLPCLIELGGLKAW